MIKKTTLISCLAWMLTLHPILQAETNDKTIQKPATFNQLTYETDAQIVLSHINIYAST